MTQALLVIPLSDNVGLKTVSISLLSAMKSQGIDANFFLPIQQPCDKIWHNWNEILTHYQLHNPNPVLFDDVVSYLGKGRIGKQALMERIVERFYALSNQHQYLIVQGIKVDHARPFLFQLNIELAHALDARVILAASAENGTKTAIADQIRIVANLLGDLPNDRVLGCVINKTEHAEKQYSFTPVHVIGSIHKLKNFDHSPIAFEREVVPYFDQTWLKNLKTTSFEKKISPPQFLTQIAIQARKANQRIVLPEGTEPRTIQAASVCTEQKIARCVLLGKPDEIQTIAKEHHIALHHDVECIDPETIRHLYIEDMVELRKNRNLTPDQAAKKLEDNVYLGAMMLHKNEVDGLVSGSIHTTANTVRPAFQLIRTAPHFNIISSVFFMCLPDQVLLYADCAIIPKPSVEELAEIAIQSADTAKAFGIPPYVSLISYSTGESGEGISVESIRDAVQIVRKQRPDIPIDGPIQYDAAVNESVGKRKAPDSPVAGKTTVCIFPDLNTGNAVYKAVQQSTKILSLGPVLQGIKKPVNDLSRGCSSEDIVYTIALAAVQASLTT